MLHCLSQVSSLAMQQVRYTYTNLHALNTDTAASCTSDRLCSCLTDDPQLCHSQCQRSTEKLVCTKDDSTDTPSTEGMYLNFVCNEK